MADRCHGHATGTCSTAEQSAGAPREPSSTPSPAGSITRSRSHPTRGKGRSGKEFSSGHPHRHRHSTRPGEERRRRERLHAICLAAAGAEHILGAFLDRPQPVNAFWNFDASGNWNLSQYYQRLRGDIDVEQIFSGSSLF
jgi:hypothetical protein